MYNQRNSKLNELFGDKKHLKKPAYSNFGENDLTVKSNSNKYTKDGTSASSHQRDNQTTATLQQANKYMESLLLQKKFSINNLGNSPSGAQNSGAAGNEAVARSVKVDRSTLPEIADQHKSKEANTGSRANSSKNRPL